MPLFEIKNKDMKLLKPIEFNKEKNIQNLIEKNLDKVFNCIFLASEYSTGKEHKGRIDTLALSEDKNPVIIEYKKTESNQLVNQSMFYLDWLIDHHGDFQVLVNEKIDNIKVDWSDIRVICIAPSYNKFDKNAVKNYGINIELWQYNLYESNMLNLEKVFPISTSDIKIRKKVDEEKTFETHLRNASKNIKKIAKDLSEYIRNIDEGIAETTQKFYTTYKLTQNFVCMDIKQNHIFLYLKINPNDLELIPENGRDVTNIGHFGTGNFELKIENSEDFENSKEYIQLSFKNVGG